MAYENWREMLKNVLKTPAQRQRIADAVQVNLVTVGRWISGGSKPRPYNIQLLLREIGDEHHDELRGLLAVEFGDIVAKEERRRAQHPRVEIPSAFYARVLELSTDIADIQRSHVLVDMILRQALEQVDNQRVGMCLSVVLCTIPRDRQHGPVRSMRELGGVGTPPWPRDLERNPIYLGVDSLSGTATTRGRPHVIQNRLDMRIAYPAQWFEFEESSAAFPLLRQGKSVAGCLLASCAQIEYFTEERRSLLERYAHLVTLAFEPGDFFEFSRVRLHIMPLYEQQKPVLATVAKRIVAKMAQANEGSGAQNIQWAEREVWLDIEDELIAMPKKFDDVTEEELEGLKELEEMKDA